VSENPRGTAAFIFAMLSGTMTVGYAKA
jgi:hypothetical protein